MMTALNPQLSLVILAHLILRSWNLMYVGLQITTMVKMFPSWMMTGGGQHQMLQSPYSQHNLDHCNHSMN